MDAIPVSANEIACLFYPTLLTVAKHVFVVSRAVNESDRHTLLMCYSTLNVGLASTLQAGNTQDVGSLS